MFLGRAILATNLLDLRQVRFLAALPDMHKNRAGRTVDDLADRDPLAFAQGRQAGGLNRTDMNEHVFRTVLRLDETEAFCGIEEFDFADGHSGLLIRYQGMTPRTRNHPKARANRRMSFANAQARRQPVAKANISSALVGQIGRKSNAFLERAVACG